MRVQYPPRVLGEFCVRYEAGQFYIDGPVDFHIRGHHSHLTVDKSFYTTNCTIDCFYEIPIDYGLC